MADAQTKAPSTGAPARKVPMRQCLGCNQHKPKKELLRVVRSPEGDVSLDFVGKKSGRGAYVCHDVKCLRRLRKSRRLESVLGVTISEDVYNQMENELLGETES